MANSEKAVALVNPLSTSDQPLISIITVVRNGAASISETLESVRAQCDADVEHVIVDGASSDGTVEIIKAFQRDRLRWISEPDQGIYDAMNKGISLARGEWFLFLGADDVLADTAVLADIFRARELTKYDLICGRSSYHGGRRCVPRLDWHTQVFNTIHHQAVFYRRRLFDDFRYRLDIPVIADYEMSFLAYKKGMSVLFLERHVAISGVHGVSHRSSQLSAQFDAFKIRGRYVNAPLNVVFLAIGLINLFVVQLLEYFPQKNRR
jgi:glycosyltransferase involved in cell wall biosynthesis